MYDRISQLNNIANRNCLVYHCVNILVRSVRLVANENASAVAN